MSDDFQDLLGDAQQETLVVIPPEPEEEFITSSKMAASGKPHPIEQWADDKELLKWMKRMRIAPIEGIESTLIGQTYAAAVWKMREAAMAGDYTATRALEIWLKWAGERLKTKPKKERVVSTGSAAFGARPTEEPPAE